FDRLTGTEFLGEYRLESPLQDEAYGGRVDARLYRWREQREVSLTEGRSGHGFIIAHFPQAALTRMCEILETYAREGSIREGSMQEGPPG
ncbi:MAG: hypothetical protein SV422_02410, partial [Pseudomonadota bacterium]|nr:hypothetical protein [Pseudomonadota bacterium]